MAVEPACIKNSIIPLGKACLGYQKKLGSSSNTWFVWILYAKNVPDVSEKKYGWFRKSGRV